MILTKDNIVWSIKNYVNRDYIQNNQDFRKRKRYREWKTEKFLYEKNNLTPIIAEFFLAMVLPASGW